VTNVADPLGGSWFVEAMTDELERCAEEIFAHIDQLGGGSILDGVVQGIEDGWFQAEIADAAYELERKRNDGRDVIVGVTDFLEGNDEPQPDILYIDGSTEEIQRKRLAQVKANRNSGAVQAALARVRTDAADPEVNLMPALIEAGRARATMGEQMSAMAEVFGRWEERSQI